jgi:hypothetical protein
MTQPLLSRPWLDAEMERIWLTAECELRRMQHLLQRPLPSSAAAADVESVLAERRRLRVGKATAVDAVELQGAMSRSSVSCSRSDASDAWRCSTSSTSSARR